MSTYLVKLLDHGGNVRVADWMICDDDAHAIRRAHEMDALPIGVGYEVWCGDRLVYSHSRAARPYHQGTGHAQPH